MRGTRAKSFWVVLLTIFLAVGTAVVSLSGCADDNDPLDSDQESPA